MKLSELPLDEFPLNSFIHGAYIPHEVCNDLITYFIDHPERHEKGELYGTGKDKNKLIYNPDIKDSTDIYLIPNGKREKYRLRDQLILKDYMGHLNSCIEAYEYKYHQASHMETYGITESVNIQKYEPGEGFKAWHSERLGRAQQTRCLVFQTYLNDVPDGGTEFLYQEITTKAERGLTLIWPSDWTHTHRSQISHTRKKYIITGWLNWRDNAV